MTNNEHLLYQNIIRHSDAYEFIINAFINALAKINRPVSDVENTPEHDATVIATAFDAFDDVELEEYINFGCKEKIAREILRTLNSEEYNAPRIQELLEAFCQIPVGNLHLPTTMTLDIRANLITHFISNHLAFLSIAKNYINMRDVATVIAASVTIPATTGVIGGKAAGMILANRIIHPTLSSETAPELEGHIEEVQSWFIRSSIINEFIAYNQLEECHSLKYLEGEEFEEQYAIMHQRFMDGNFRKSTLEKFQEIIDEADNAPLILRSSSFLEDRIGCSFTGKYESIFISNQGSYEDKLKSFAQAIKNVYLSLYSSSAIAYRRDNQLLDYNEKMSVLVQKVVGRQYGKYFLPAAGMVGFSHNPYCWNKRICKEDGMLRMVMGLGTRAVDRVGDDYPRMVSLSAPMLRPEVTKSEKMRYSQKYVDVLNLESDKIETLHFVDLINYIWEQELNFPINEIISIDNGGVLSKPMFRPDKLKYDNCAITFDGLLSRPEFPRMMQYIFKKIEKAYGMPVDLEFAWDNEKLYLLQCRTLSSRSDGPPCEVVVPKLPESQTLFRINDAIRSAELDNIEYAVYVDHLAYSNMRSIEKMQLTARMVGLINRHLSGKKFILMGPGRWGSNNPELGIGVKYSDINRTSMLIELGFKSGGSAPELSYGTHFFQDLVEADIIPLPLFPEQEGHFLNLEMIDKATNSLPEIHNFQAEYRDVIKVIDFRNSFGSLLQIKLDGESGCGCAYFT